jgi:DNA adenine methylase
MEVIRLLRYPGGKQRILNYILPFLPDKRDIKGRYVEPFLGSGAVFFALNPQKALLSDINPDLIDIYKGIRKYPREVWKIYLSLPKDKESYYRIRGFSTRRESLDFKAARLLYLNRTCFKGMWRQNLRGEFNIGYGGLDRVWVLNKQVIDNVSKRLKKARLICSDFEPVIDNTKSDDFIFADPPYKPRGKELLQSHYYYNKFSFNEYRAGTSIRACFE